MFINRRTTSAAAVRNTVTGDAVYHQHVVVVLRCTRDCVKPFFFPLAVRHATPCLPVIGQFIVMASLLLLLVLARLVGVYLACMNHYSTVHTANIVLPR